MKRLLLAVLVTIWSRRLLVAAVCCTITLGGALSAAARSPADLNGAARQAGIAVSARIFEERAASVPEAPEPERERPVVSGKMVLLGAAMISAAIVSAAFILRDRCVPARGELLRLPRLRPPPAREGVPPPAPPHLPDIPLPDMCVPR